MRERRRGRIAKIFINQHSDFVGGEHFQGGGKGGLGKRMRVLGEKERPGGLLRGAVLDDGLRDGGNVIVIERSLECGAAMAGSAEGHALRGDAGIRMQRVVRGDQVGELDELVG